MEIGCESSLYYLSSHFYYKSRTSKMKHLLKIKTEEELKQKVISYCSNKN